MKTPVQSRKPWLSRYASLLPLFAFVSNGCSGDLEDKELYESQVTEGLGAKGVSRPLPSGMGTVPAPTNNPTDPQPTATGVTPSPTTPPSGGLSAACADIEDRVFRTKCAGGGCHGEPGAPATFYSDLGSQDNLAPAVKDVPAKGSCTSMKLVDSANPSNSAILKVIGTDYIPCTSSQMPAGLSPLTAEEVACVTEWVNAIASGAL
jgi:hypothetical protein